MLGGALARSSDNERLGPPWFVCRPNERWCSLWFGLWPDVRLARPGAIKSDPLRRREKETAPPASRGDRCARGYGDSIRRELAAGDADGCAGGGAPTAAVSGLGVRRARGQGCLNLLKLQG